MVQGRTSTRFLQDMLAALQTIDLDELAARLGSIVTFDRCGDIIWCDGFEDGLAKWTPGLGGGGSRVDLSRARARNGLYSACLTTSLLAPTTVMLTHEEPFPGLSDFGYELSFSLASIIDELQFHMWVADGVRLAMYQIYWSDTRNELSYLNAAGVRTVFANGVDLTQAATLFHTLKLVVNGGGRKYARLLLDAATYPLAVPVLSYPSATSPRLFVGSMLTGRGSFNDQVHLDDFILTRNEAV